MRAVLALLLLAPQVLFSGQDRRIDEASGIARGLRSPGVYYVQNDSGDSARFFAIDRRTGQTAAILTVPGATNVDWEDLAVARDADGTRSVWIGDIGDNDAQRKEIELYRLDEPSVSGQDRDRRITTARPDVWHLRYPDGAQNAESLAVQPGGTAYVITKSLSGVSGVYRVPPDPSSDVQTLQRVGTIRFPSTGRSIPVAATFASLLATGASVSANGGLLAVRTYTEAYLWTIRGGDLAAALRTTPRHVSLPDQKQGEGITIDGNRLVVNSEGTRQPVYALPVPPAPVVPSSTSPSTSPTPAPTPSSASPPTSATAPSPTATASAAAGSGRPDRTWAEIGGASGGVVAFVAAVALLRRRRKAAG